MTNFLKGDRRDIPIPRYENSNLSSGHHVLNVPYNDAEVHVRTSLDQVLELLPKSLIQNDEFDESFAAIGLSAKYYTEALTRHEVQVLACSVYQAKRGRNLTYGDILKLTSLFNDGQAMVVTMIYKTLEKLSDRGFLVKLDELDENDNRSRVYQIQQSGKEAFRMAVLNSRILSGSLSPVAA